MNEQLQVLNTSTKTYWKRNKMRVDPVKCYGFFDFQLDVEDQQLLQNGKHVALTHKAFQILLLLVQNAGHTTTKAEIFEQLWADSFVEDSNLTQYIHVLRKVLGQTPDGRSYVETVPRVGYRFTLHGDEIAITTNESTLPDDLADQPSEGRLWAILRRFTGRRLRTSSTVPEKKPYGKVQRSRFDIRVLFVIIGTFLTLQMVATPAFYYLTQKTEQLSPLDDSPITSIAVMPFKPVGERVDKEKLGVGMSDAVITSLSKMKQLSVRPTSAISRYSSKQPADSSVAGRDLKVEGVLEGMVQCDGSSVRVSVQLIRVEDGKPMWAESFQEKLSDNFTMQDAISSRVVASLSNRLARPALIPLDPAGKDDGTESIPIGEE
jgi:TolB-like protein/DNA-binding winged helix-turn-helix (wHTH) protein